MKIKLLAVMAILISFSCEGELEDCYTTVCSGPDNTNCIDEPNFNSGCFPMDNGRFESSLVTKIND